MTRDERKAMQARVAVRVLAEMWAKNAVKAHILFAKRATSGASAAGGAGKCQCKSRRGAALDALEGILNDIGLTPR